MYSNKIEHYKKTLKLTSKQRQIIIGKLLGDGHLETSNDGKTYRLKIEHSFKQKDYVDWCYQELKDWVLTKPQIKKQTFNGKAYEKYWFNTLSHSSFRFYAHQFCPQGKKVIPKLIHRWLTPLSLAIWFMDDGSIKSKNHRARILNTQCFSVKEIRRLIQVLHTKFDLNCKIRKQKEGYQIMILAESVNKFYNLIKEFIIPSMDYKLKGLD